MKRLWVFFVWLPLFAAGIVPNRYIVELSAEPVAAHVRHLGRRGLRSEAARAHRMLVRAEQQQARQQMAAEQASVIDSVDTVVNALVVEIPDARAARLRKLPGVRRVHPVREFHLTLDHALPLHHVPEAWSQVGVENAGAGVKIAIIDTGIEIGHPGFQDASLPVPDGFPRVNTDSDLAFTNSKVIVARSYAHLLRKPDPDPSPRDRMGHGTATAMVAAGVSNTGPLATISGVAPKAYLGSYKVFGSPGVNESAPEDGILKAIDDAVADGMDVINLSLGSDVAARPEDDIEVQALERAAAMGVIVVVSAGNNGPDPNTIGSPATAPSAIAVGASSNDRIFSAAVLIPGEAYRALPGSGPRPAEGITASVFDVARLDRDGLACSSLPPGSLSGTIAFILRGTCTFEEKLNNAQRAGAIAALLYSDEQRPEPIGMSVGGATLPAEMVSYQSGLEIKQKLQTGLTATLQFTIGPVYSEPDRLANFSAKGPNPDGAIKPDLVAVGTSLYTAAETSDPKGIIFDAGGYSIEHGTSFSAPLVAGAAALLKSARPGLTAAQYRSLLINSAAQSSLTPGVPARAQQAGAGLLNLDVALRSTTAVWPASLSFGAGGADASLSRHLTISNIGTATETFLLSVIPRDGGPALSLPMDSIQLDPGASADFDVGFSSASLPPGQYEGSLSILGASSGVEMRVRYWYGIPSGVPRYITLLDSKDDVSAGSLVRDAILFRVTDSSGLVAETQPEVTVVSGGGTVVEVRSRDRLSPGMFSVNLRMGGVPGSNVFRIQVGDITRTITIVTH